MDEAFKIFVDQLRDGRETKIRETLDSDFLEINEAELAFEKPVEVDGVAYLAEQELVINWSIRAEALIPCSICNRNVPVEIEINHFYHAEPLSDIKSGVFNFKMLLREIILLEVPAFAECEGHCPRRNEIKKYLKEPAVDEQSDEKGYRPFADLDWK